MQRTLSKELSAFQQDIQSFIERYWDRHWDQQPTNARAGIRAGDVARWRQALVDKGYSVPAWPEEAGGTGWDATRLFLWHQACAAAGVPGQDDPGVDIVGPWLLHRGSEAQQAQFLPGIKSLQARWAIAFAEVEAGTDYTAMATRATADVDGWRLQGAKTRVMGGRHADWYCCFARLDGGDTAGLFAVPADSEGLKRTPAATMDGADDMADLTFDGVRLPEVALLGGVSAAGDLAQLLVTRAYSTLSASAVAAAQLQVLDATLESLDPDDDLHLKRHAAAVALSALQALELRYVDALQRGLEPPYPLAVLQVKSREILLQLGTLQLESFGYYALPYPDEMLLHNEGPVGPPQAAAAVRQNLTRQVAALYEGGAERLTEELIDAIWRDTAGSEES